MNCLKFDCQIDRYRLALFAFSSSLSLASFRISLWTGPKSYREVETIDRLHLGDYPYPSLVELTEAIRYAMSIGVENIYQRNQYLGKAARLALREVPSVELYDLTHGTMGTVPANVRGVSAETAVAKLEQRGIIACVAYEENAVLGLRKCHVPGIWYQFNPR